MLPDKDINLRKILRIVFSEKIKIVFITLFISVAAFIYILNEENIYMSSAKLFNKSEIETQGLNSSTISAFLNVGDGSGNSSEYALSKLHSRDFFSILIEDKDVLKNLFAAESISNQKITYDESKLKLISKNEYFEKAFDKYKKLFQVNKNRSSGLITLSVKHVSPIFAKDFLELIIKKINIEISLEDSVESTNSIFYLESSYASYNNITTKQSITKLIEKNLEKKVLSEINNENYIFKIVEKPFVPEEKIYPARTSFMIVSFILSFLFSIILIISKHIFINKN